MFTGEQAASPRTRRIPVRRPIPFPASEQERAWLDEMVDELKTHLGPVMSSARATREMLEQAIHEQYDIRTAAALNLKLREWFQGMPFRHAEFGKRTCYFRKDLEVEGLFY